MTSRLGDIFAGESAPPGWRRPPHRVEYQHARHAPRPRPHPGAAMPVRTPAAVLALTAAVCATPARAADPVDFAHDVLPLLKARCAECHTNGKYKGGVSYDTRSEAVKKAVVAGKSGDSLLVQRITAKDPEERMPPTDPPLTEKEVAVFKAWIDAGAPWQ